MSIAINTKCWDGLTPAGIAFIRLADDTEPITEAVISGNTISDFGAGISFETAAGATGNTLTDNSTSGNVQYGVVVAAGNNGNTFEHNVADNNGAAGISAGSGTSGNTFVGNSMHENGTDAIDLSGSPVYNTWTNNSCTTDNPEGLCTLP